MTLAKSHKKNEKIVAYLNGNQILANTIEQRIREFTGDNEAKKDLKIILNKVKNLIEVCNKLFNKKELEDDICSKCVGKTLDSNTKTVIPLTGGKKSKTSKKQSKKTSKKLSKKISKNK